MFPINDIIMQVVTFALGGVAGKLLDFTLGKRKNDAEIDVVVSDNWKKYAEKIEEQFTALGKEYDELREKYYALYREYQEFKIQTLSKQTVSNAKGNHHGGT